MCGNDWTYFREVFAGEDKQCIPAGNSPSPLFFVSGQNRELEVFSFLSVLK
jgi:hypothetical protein